MKQIGTPYKDYYFLLEDGKVYNSRTNRYLKANNHQYKLLCNDDNIHTISLKKLYRKVYDKEFCVDTITDLDGEQWKEIENSGGNYFVSNMGRIKSYKDYIAKILTDTTTEQGYKRISIDLDGSGKCKSYFTHRIIAEYFLQPPTKPFSEIHHKDFNSMNNKADNLCWLTRKEHQKIHMQNNSDDKEQAKNGNI